MWRGELRPVSRRQESSCRSCSSSRSKSISGRGPLIQVTDSILQCHRRDGKWRFCSHDEHRPFVHLGHDCMLITELEVWSVQPRSQAGEIREDDDRRFGCVQNWSTLPSLSNRSLPSGVREATRLADGRQSWKLWIAQEDLIDTRLANSPL